MNNDFLTKLFGRGSMSAFADWEGFTEKERKAAYDELGGYPGPCRQELAMDSFLLHITQKELYIIPILACVVPLVLAIVSPGTTLFYVSRALGIWVVLTWGVSLFIWIRCADEEPETAKPLF